MLWPIGAPFDRRIRFLLTERMERGATNELDRKIMALITACDAVARAGWFS